MRDELSRRALLRLAALFPWAASALLKASAEPASSHLGYRNLEAFIPPGHDDFACEAKAMYCRAQLQGALISGKLPLSPSCQGTSPKPVRYHPVPDDAAAGSLSIAEAVFSPDDSAIAAGWTAWVESLGSVRRAEFYPLPNDLVRYEVATHLCYRVGLWKVQWSGDLITRFQPLEEHRAVVSEPLFRDVTAGALAAEPSFQAQLSRGVPYWRSRLDPALGIDIYGSNGIAVGDIDNDGSDEIYVCQPGGLPNRLFRVTAEGKFHDITEQWGLGLLDETSCALFLDLRNSGRQDLVILRSAGPLLFINEGEQFRQVADAFAFKTPPLGGFTGMAAADFDRDGKLDLYLCCYVYFQSEAQFTYPAPYQDAQNGPPNFLFRNQLTANGSGTFEDVTSETGIDQNNNRFSFAPAWCDFNDDGWPDLYVANDFGRKNLYVNRKGRFRDEAAQAGVEDLGPGMSASWFDYDRDGRPDLYVANMWSDAGQRVINDPHFAPARLPGATGAFARHTRGNSLYRNRGDGSFTDATGPEHAAFGRWAWSTVGCDWDNDGSPEIYGTCGMLTNTSKTDLMSFFWRQVVAQSPPGATTSAAYQNGWNAINQFIREDFSWNGHEPNVFHVRRNGRYYDCSGVSGLDVAEDSRAFAITDFDNDGRPDIILKSRLGPQVRVFQNNCAGPHASLAVTLEGTQSNRDAIGARVTVANQTQWLQAGSGFLSQHSKRIIFGLGQSTAPVNVHVRWPSGFEQTWPDCKPGFTHHLREGSQTCQRSAFTAQKKLDQHPEQGRNNLALEDTWFLQPIPLPEKQTGPQILVLLENGSQAPAWPDIAHQPLFLGAGGERRQQYEIFRRYLFDWRTQLQLPQAFLLNANGHVVKIYGSLPDVQHCRADLSAVDEHARRAIPFPGFYHAEPHRDFAKYGIAYLAAGFPQQALPYLEQVLQRRPDDARILILAGQIKLESHQFAEAQKHFEKALESPNAGAEAAYGLGASLARQNRLREAQPWLEKAIELRPDYADAINDLGTLFVQQDKTADAEAAFRYGIRVDPNEDILYLNLGRVLIRQGRLDQARQLMQDLLDRKPDSETARKALAELNGR